MLTEEIKSKIIEHANTSNNEVCGLLIHSESGLDIQKTENLINSATEFMMNLDSSSDIAAYYHSHINFDAISEADKIVSERLGLGCVVYNKQSGSFHTYSPTGYKIQYTGRPFLLGFADCLWLVKDYYCHDLNIHLCPELEVLKNSVSEEEYNEMASKRFINEAESLKNKDDYLKKYFEHNGFRRVSDLKKNDVLITRTEKFNFPIHCAVYLGKDTILHHPGDGISTTERLSNGYKKWVTYIMRHNLYD
jgi:proteasome lid subunit RPN8/RPN11